MTRPIPTLTDKRLASSFKNFQWKCHRYLRLPDPTPLQYDMADYLQYGGDWIELMAFRGAAKSYGAVMYCGWEMYRDPENTEILNVSATGPGAGANAVFMWQMLRGFDWLAHLRPRADQRQSSREFDVNGKRESKNASFAAESIFGQITQRRANIILADDIEVPNTSDTDGMRADLERRNGELGAAILLPGGRLIHLGTAQTEDTVYLKQERAGSALRIYPILYPDPLRESDEKLRSMSPVDYAAYKYGHRLAPKIVRELRENPHLAGTSTEPGRFDEENIARRELLWGRTEFSRQFLCDLAAGAAASKPIKLRDIMVLDLTPGGHFPAELRWGPSPETEIKDLQVDALTGDKPYAPAYVGADSWGAPEGVHMHVDPSGEGKDETTWEVTAQRFGYVFLVLQGASRDGHSDDTLKRIAQDAKLAQVNSISVEGNLGQGMFASLLRPHLQAPEINHPCEVEVVNVGKAQKEKRIISTLEPVTTGHRLVIARHVLEQDFKVDYPDIEEAKRRFYRLTYQLTRITRQRGCLPFDDRVDGLAGSCAKWVEVLQRRTQDASKRDQEAKLEAEIEKVIETRRKQGLLPKDATPQLPGLVSGGRPPNGLLGFQRRR